MKIIRTINGTATPDRSEEVNLIVLTQDTLIAEATGERGGRPWSIFLRQDSVGGHRAIFDDSYLFHYSLSSPFSPPDSQCCISFLTDESGTSYIAGQPSIDQPGLGLVCSEFTDLITGQQRVPLLTGTQDELARLRAEGRIA